MLFIGPVYLLVLYGGGLSFSDGWSAICIGLLKFLGVVILIVLVRNTAPRLRIDQAMKLLWGPVTLGAIVALLLAWRGL
jgi:NADH-quinone oxidoreductase subunit H